MNKPFPYTSGMPVDRDRIIVVHPHQHDKIAFDMWARTDVVIKEYDNNTYMIVKNRYGDSNVLVKEQFNIFDFVI